MAKNDDTQYIPRHDDDDRTLYYDLGDTQPMRSAAYLENDETQMISVHESDDYDHERTRIHWPLSPLMTFALVALVIGVSFWGYAFFALFGHKGDVQREQNSLIQEWDQSTPTPTTTKQVIKPRATPTSTKPSTIVNNALQLSAHNSVAKVTIPRLGMTWIVVEGVSESDIAYTPGHYPGSAQPGQVGNFAVAGHRSPGIFWDLDKLQSGDLITVENKAHKIFTYKVTRNFITNPQSWPEVSQTPPGFSPGAKVLTLTTCNPKWDNYQRLVIHAVMV